MPKRPSPLFDESALSPVQLARQRARIVARSSRIRRARGEPLSPTGRLERYTYDDAVYVCMDEDARRAERLQDRALRCAVARALPKVVRGLRQAHDLRLVPTSTEGAALRRRRRRLLELRPTGATESVWREIVAHFGCMCAACGRPASRASWLPTGDPVPVCAAHA